MSGFIEFELDLMHAVIEQLVPKIDAMGAGSLTVAAAQKLPEAQGVYVLIHNGAVRYVGKTDSDDGLRSRLARHALKFEMRRNIMHGEVLFKAVQVYVLTAMDIESRLIKHYKAAWNGSGFGSNDPGRERETTNKPEVGFDAQFPIEIDEAVDFLTPGVQPCIDVLVALKDNLPFTLRYELKGKSKGGNAYVKKAHPDFYTHTVDIPAGPITVHNALKLIVGALPTGWLATEFVSHAILYNESRNLSGAIAESW